MGSKCRKFILDDGSEWDTFKLSEHIGISQSSAYYRLNKSSDPAKVLRPKDRVKATNGFKLYVLDDGTEWTVPDVVKSTGCKKSTASTRLSMYTDPAKVLAPPLSAQTSSLNSRNQEAIRAERMFYDPNGHWKLIMRATS